MGINLIILLALNRVRYGEGWSPSSELEFGSPSCLAFRLGGRRTR